MNLIEFRIQNLETDGVLFYLQKRMMLTQFNSPYVKQRLGDRMFSVVRVIRVCEGLYCISW